MEGSHQRIKEIITSGGTVLSCISSPTLHRVRLLKIIRKFFNGEKLEFGEDVILNDFIYTEMSVFYKKTIQLRDVCGKIGGKLKKYLNCESQDAFPEEIIFFNTPDDLKNIFASGETRACNNIQASLRDHDFSDLLADICNFLQPENLQEQETIPGIVSDKIEKIFELYLLFYEMDWSLFLEKLEEYAIAGNLLFVDAAFAYWQAGLYEKARGLLREIDKDVLGNWGKALVISMKYSCLEFEGGATAGELMHKIIEDKSVSCISEDIPSVSFFVFMLLFEQLSAESIIDYSKSLFIYERNQPHVINLLRNNLLKYPLGLPESFINDIVGANVYILTKASLFSFLNLAIEFNFPLPDESILYRAASQMSMSDRIAYVIQLEQAGGSVDLREKVLSSVDTDHLCQKEIRMYIARYMNVSDFKKVKEMLDVFPVENHMMLDTLYASYTNDYEKAVVQLTSAANDCDIKDKPFEALFLARLLCLTGDYKNATMYLQKLNMTALLPNLKVFYFIIQGDIKKLEGAYDKAILSYTDGIKELESYPFHRRVMSWILYFEIAKTELLRGSLSAAINASVKGAAESKSPRNMCRFYLDVLQRNIAEKESLEVMNNLSGTRSFNYLLRQYELEGLCLLLSAKICKKSKECINEIINRILTLSGISGKRILLEKQDDKSILTYIMNLSGLDNTRDCALNAGLMTEIRFILKNCK